ncbi:fumarylacetoacetate hydrolase family protein [Runella sp. MFBS21]|uniref:fumarylacetoacetate hydrolase family protein n=1 Tax=Runella sp. MFBS21 TaxID=3034018 RepID=UPI0023F7F773|nr:fumarylacetoacetate hydrolase family protein [Runella sp. MFBS21]MDF7819492.1 fumarylacetoacetate hydrolase family protein [Runella sp. MFBS21]
MKLYRTSIGFYVNYETHYYHLPHSDWDVLINRDDLYDYLKTIIQAISPADFVNFSNLLAPIGTQEVWASGVTYYRSKIARMEEAKEVGGDVFYERAYEGERPELFFKSIAQKVVHPRGTVNIRPDSTWNVPEPEWTLFATSSGKIVGYTIGNDMSSRSIEGENPLYLPQAKVYDGSAALGPCLHIPAQPMSLSTAISIEISRASKLVFEGRTTLDQLKRQPEELVSWLFRSNTFSTGVFLMTGTGLVPSSDFTLELGDVIHISIDMIGELINTVGIAKG